MSLDARTSVTGASVKNGVPVPDKPEGNVPEPSEIYKAVRTQLEHVNNDTGQRVIWLTIGQSFFFGAYAGLLTAKEGLPELAAKYHALLTVLPIAALLSVVLTYVDVIASIFYMRGLRKAYEEAPKDERTDGFYPLIHGAAGHRVFQHLSPMLLPALFLVTWIYVLAAG